MSLLNVYKKLQPRGYSRGQYLIEDRTLLSPDYFVITDFPSILTGGKNIIRLKGNGANLRLGSTIDVEIVDALGDPIFCEFSNFIDRFGQYYITIDIYDNTPPGQAIVYLVGQASHDRDGNTLPLQPKDVYNVRWARQLNIQPSERNISDLVFDKPPIVDVVQVYAPARLQSQATSSGYVYQNITSSANQLKIVSSDFQGFDRDFSSSPDILDPRVHSIMINPSGQTRTVNSVDTTVRQYDKDIEGGYRIDYTTRFNTLALATSSFFRKEYLGGVFEFYSTSSVPSNLTPPIFSNATISGSLQSQLARYSSHILEVVNDHQALLSEPISVITISSRSLSENKLSSHTYKQASGFTANITYAPSDTSYAESITVSQSYLEFTFSDLKPIGGEVYRIKTYTKRGASTGDFKLLNDQIIKPVEYLNDALFPNNTSYAYHESDYLLTGYFTTQSVLDTYWYLHKETPGVFTLVSGSISDNVLIDSVALPASYTQSMVLSSKFNQNYNGQQQYTLSCYAYLDPYTELEVYVGSTELNYNIIAPNVYPQAFFPDKNLELDRTSQQYSVFGKLIGKIVNDRPIGKYYGKVCFDFITDNSGFGKPIFRSRIIDETPTLTGSVRLGELSIKPFKQIGFTPNITQFAVPLTVELATFFSVISQSVDFKIEYYDYTGRQSEYVTYLDDVTVNLKGEIPSNTCQSETNFFSYSTANTGVINRNQITRQIRS